MRFMTKKTVSLSALATLAVVWSGCTGKKTTEYVAGVSTQVQVPRDLKTVRVDVAISPGGAGSSTLFCRTYKVYDGHVQLPRSLGSFKGQDSSSFDPITFTISGYDYETEDPAIASAVNDCLDTPVKVTPGGPNGDARILRRSRQPYVTDKILFLPMPLRYACFDVSCKEDETCKGGKCVPSVLADPTKLREFSDDLVDGTGGDCFHASQCLGLGEPPELVNADDCTYALPNTKSAPPHVAGTMPNPVGPPPGLPWDGINVQVVYDGGANTEILDLENDEGFFVPDPAKPQQFRLAPGLCELVKGVGADGKPTLHRISAIRASGTCQSKAIDQPLCAADALAAMGADATGVVADATSPTPLCQPTNLRPAHAVVMLLADDSQNSETFFGDTGEARALDVPLQDPAFANTDVGLMFFPGVNGGAPLACTDPHPRALDPETAKTAQPKIAAAIKGQSASLATRDTPANLEGALHDAYAYLGQSQFAGYYRRAVVIFGNRGFLGNACYGGTQSQASSAFSGARIKTSAILLSNNHTAMAAPPDPFSDALTLVGPAGGQAFDGRSSQQNAFNAFDAIRKDLASCAYDFDTAPGNDAVLTYTDPVSGVTAAIPPAAGCTTENATANGWGFDATPGSKRILVCGAACDAYRGVLTTAFAYAAQTGQPALAVPVFAHTKSCAPKAGPVASGGGMMSGGNDGGLPAPDAGPMDSGTNGDGGDGG